MALPERIEVPKSPVIDKTKLTIDSIYEAIAAFCIPAISLMSAA